MERRSQVYKDVSTQFSFLNNLRLSEEEYSRCCSNLVSFYQEDPSIDIVGEVQQFQYYIHSKYEGKKTDFTHAELYDIIVQDQIRSAFPNCISNFPYLHADKCFGRAIVFATQENKETLHHVRSSERVVRLAARQSASNRCDGRLDRRTLRQGAWTSISDL